ncbi:hypothetical protein [Sebaldella sp. S0638]|uniref:hypothetical protein n=1 Tax=Sebaldella sp. S0638 TaxID=2957809 RepID=UPI00209F6E69|nr:hypothetical protein [Sebaldella sp. S0638]MCP1226089.1 hypothetical protein [Sebaldella sp. S0638]
MVKDKPSRRESNESAVKIKKIISGNLENFERYKIVYAVQKKKSLFKKDYITYLVAYNDRTKDVVFLKMDQEIKEIEEMTEIEQEDVISAKIIKDNRYKLATHSKEFEFEVPEFTLKNQNLLPVLQKEESEAFRNFFENALITIKKVKIVSGDKKNNN